MKRTFIIGLIAIIGLLSFTTPKPPTFQQKWEHYSSALRAYSDARQIQSVDTVATLAILIPALSAIKNYDLETELENVYGSNWKSGPLSTICPFICAIAYAVCPKEPYNETYGTGYWPCERTYRDCMRMCGAIPQGM